MNEEVCVNYVFKIEFMEFDEVKVLGVMVLFGEKYDEKVWVVMMGFFFVELCGGIYVKSIGEIGLFKIVIEVGIVLGVCWIEVVIGEYVIVYV